MEGQRHVDRLVWLKYSIIVDLDVDLRAPGKLECSICPSLLIMQSIKTGSSSNIDHLVFSAFYVYSP